MKENKKKTSREKKVLIGALSLAAVTMASSTFAWFTSKDEVTNRLSANADYNVRIVESFAAPNNWLPGNVTNKDVYATNTGNIPAFVKEEVSGVLTITKETPTNTFNVDSSVELTQEERYVIEAGAFLAYKPTGSDCKLGDMAVIRPADSADMTNKTNFDPDVDGLYVFRRSIVVEGEGDSGIERFKYEGYYVNTNINDEKKFYKISNLVVTPDGADDIADDGVRTDGNLTAATCGFYEYTHEVVTPVNLTYEAENNRLVATYDTEFGATNNDETLKALAQAYDKACHDLDYATQLKNNAQNISSDNDSATKTKFEALQSALNNKTAKEKAKSDAEIAKAQAEKNRNDAQKNYDTLAKAKNDSSDILGGLKTDLESKETAKDDALGSTDAFTSELNNWKTANNITATNENLTVEQLKSFKDSISDTNEKHNQFIANVEYLIAVRKYNDELDNFNTLSTKLNNAFTVWGEAESNLTEATNTFDRASAELTEANETYQTAWGEWNTANGTSTGSSTELSNAIAEYNKAVAAKNAAKEAYEEALKNVGENEATGVLTIYINLSNDVTLTGGVADKWQMLPATVENKTAVFYYTGILLGSETSSKLIDSVELADTVTTDMYKSFDFDLNIALDSVQITYGEDNETIITKGATDELNAVATLTNPKDLETAISWGVSAPTSPTTPDPTPDSDSDPNTDTP